MTVDHLLGDSGDEPRGPVRQLPAALAEFIDGPVFGAALSDMSSRWRTDEARLRDEWTNVLANVQVAGRQPQTEADWMFLFETVRRAVDH